MNIERALATPGWMDETELAYLAQLAETHTAILEVGSWCGRSARSLADNTLGHVWCVDTWADNSYGNAPAEITGQPDWLFNEFRRYHADTIAADKVRPVRATSVQAASILAQAGATFDLVFIDGGHNYEDVIADINMWRPLLQPGGVLCGHDLYPQGPFWPGVLQAVNELVVNYTVTGTIWTAQ